MEDEDIILFGSSLKSNNLKTLQPDLNTQNSNEFINDVSNISTFSDLKIDKWLKDILFGVSINEPSAVQKFCIPNILLGKDVIASAPTGSGKTATFAIPILQEFSRNSHAPYALILTPTRYFLHFFLFFRELAIQIHEQFQIFSRHICISICLAIGGLDMMDQAIKMNNKPHIIIATPGRLSDLLSSGQIKLDYIRFIVFDEADRILDKKSSFVVEEIPEIISNINSSLQHEKLQYLMFSATMSADVKKFHSEYRNIEPFIYSGNSEYGVVGHLDQEYLLVPSQVRDSYLVYLLRERYSKKKIIIFTGKCITCELVFRMLKELKIYSVTLHGKMHQKARISSLKKFRDGIVPILISTDVGSRGLDIPTVDIVINFDIPADARDYVHRVGRAARAGRPGLSMSFIHELDVELLKSIEKKIQKPLALSENIPETKIISLLNEVSTAKRSASMTMHDIKFGEKSKNNKKKWSKKME